MKALKFCRCPFPRKIKQIGGMDRASLEGGGHTAFIIIRCGTCGGFGGFPQENFDLAVKKGTIATKDALMEFFGKQPKEISDG